MMLVEETTTSDAGLPVGEFKAHLRLGTGFSEDQVQDALLQSFLRAALSAIEARTGKILLERDFSWVLAAWRDPVAQALPVAPVTQVLEMVITDRLGIEAPVSPDAWRLEPDMHRPRLVATEACLPTVPRGGTARLTFRAGFGAAWGDIPADLAQAVLLLAAHYYEYRDETSLGRGCMPFGVSSLIERYRTVRLLAGHSR
ncbi:head-tail connector protein [Sediminimonas sp.]|uniref:head-tail connector protein n=1 Tax=Sediminimonas sp. TaxID=2823379 RepID=UPI0025D9BDE1|nr:head-tail connector protein [Sediminimonas sp.]